MEYLPTKIPRKALEDLSFKLIPPETPEDTTISLIISIDDKNINIREFGAFLTYLDWIYGKFQPKGIYSYSHVRNYQLSLTKIKKGSIELEFSNTLANSNALIICLIWFILKFLPSFIKQLTSVLKDTATTVKEFEDIKFIRLKRKILREIFRRDSKLKKLDNKRINQFAKFLDKFSEIEKKEKQAAIRFSNNNIIKIEIRIENKGKT